MNTFAKDVLYVVWNVPEVKSCFPDFNLFLSRVTGSSSIVPPILRGAINDDKTCLEATDRGKNRCPRPRAVGSPYCTYHTNRKKKNGAIIPSTSPSCQVVPCFDENGIVLVPVNQRALNELVGAELSELPKPFLPSYIAGLPVYTELN